MSGAEGLFSISRTASGWQTSQQLDCEVSEVCYTRFNGDSHYSLATIEPFHGTKLCVYRSEDGGWKKCVESELSFGHGLWAGNFNGIPSIFVGNRTQGKELLHFVVDSKTYGYWIDCFKFIMGGVLSAGFAKSALVCIIG